MDRYGKQRVLIAGGGVAALEAALALRSIAQERVHVELLCPEPRFWYKPLAVAAPFDQGSMVHLDLDGLARELGADFTLGSLVAIDAWRHIAHTSRNTQIEYDVLLVAAGALPVPAIPGALTFRGPADIEAIESVLHDLGSGKATSLALVIPWGATYPLPAYELALLAASQLARLGVDGVEIRVVTPEAEPLQVFGPAASEAIRELLADRGVELETSAYATEVADGVLRLLPEGAVEADRIVALARLVGAPIGGIPQTVHGFVPVDDRCRVHGIADVYAAGDITSFPVKQGGIATQQADVAAEAIAAAAGADVDPAPFRPVLHGVLLTGDGSRYLRRELAADPAVEPTASPEPLWWPPAKIVGRHLAPFLAAHVGEAAPSLPEIPGALEVEHTLEAEAARELELDRVLMRAEGDDDPSVANVMTSTPLVVAPEDTLGATAELMLPSRARAVVVAEYGRPIGILTRTDLLQAAAARAHPAEARVRQWMTAEPVFASPQTTVEGARLALEQYDIDHLPVVDGETIVGMVDRDQLERVPVLSPGLGF
jgi:sulfide:quinone oxidoreductase